LIEKINHMNYDIYFYDGIDFEMIRKHNDDSGEFLIFFIKSWKDEVIKYRRDKKIKNILYDIDDKFDPDLIEKNTVAIYLTNGYVMETYKSIKEKIILKSNYDPLYRDFKGKVNI